MLKLTAAVTLALLIASPASAQVFGITADGTWDCSDDAGANLGTIALADESYAFLKPDGLFGGYGKLFRAIENTDLPAFAIIDGPLKDEFAASALALLGPRENTLDYTGDLFLYLVISPEKDFQCLRRLRPGA